MQFGIIICMLRQGCCFYLNLLGVCGITTARGTTRACSIRSHVSSTKGASLRVFKHTRIIPGLSLVLRLSIPFDLKSVSIYTPFRARAMRMLVNIQTKSERADKKVWENNGLSGSNSDVVIANENSLDLAFIYPLKC